MPVKQDRTPVIDIRTPVIDIRTPIIDISHRVGIVHKINPNQVQFNGSLNSMMPKGHKSSNCSLR